MEAIDLLLTRRSLKARSMTQPGPTEAELQTILAAGIRVPDHGKLFPWRIQVLDSAAQENLGKLCAEFFATENPEADSGQLAVEQQRPCHAPLLLVVTNRILQNHHIPAIEQVLSGGAVCQNILNAAHFLGYVGQWLTEWPTYDSRVKEALGHSADDDMIGWIYIGSAEQPAQSRVRATPTDVVSRWPQEQPQASKPVAGQS